MAIEPNNILRVIGVEHINAAVTAITAALRKSFELHPMRHQTDDETTRRFNKCVDIVGVLVNDCKWSPQRAFDHLGKYLIDDLNGVAWKPAEGRVWLPSQG
jgi:hypothetical protein